MPAPFTIVYLRDDEGDEFPIRLDGTGYSDIAAWRNACLKMEEMFKNGDCHPVGGLTLGRVEES